MLDIIDLLKKEIIVILLSMMPIIEVRGAIPVGISFGLSTWNSILISIVGNIIIVPFLLKLLRPIMIYLEKTRIFAKTVGWVKNRAMRKSDVVKKYSLVGLYIFVAIPIPGTGAWTGSVIASLLKLDLKKAFLAISLGVISAGLIVGVVSYGLFSIF